MAGRIPTYSAIALLAVVVVTLADTRQCPVPSQRCRPAWSRSPDGRQPRQHQAVDGSVAAGVIKADPRLVDKDGSIHMKVGWWRGVSRRLSIQGHRLDASAPLLG
jgi:hypothetical protein